MDIIFMNSGSCKTFDPHRLLLNHPDKINLKRSDKFVALSNLVSCTKIDLRFQCWHGMKSLNYQMDHIL